jgi:hypothetical protein
MPRCISSFCTALCSLMAVSSSLSPSKANIFDDIAGIVTDPFKLKAASSTLSDSMQRSLAQLEKMEDKTNNHVAERLEQMRTITDSIIIGAQTTIDKATADMLVLESKIDTDAIGLIYQAVCAANVTMDQGRRTFAAMVADLGKSNPGIYLFGIRIIDFRTKKISIDKPDDAYNSVKDAEYKVLVKTLTDQTKAYSIVSYYANLERMAKYTLCFYKDDPSNIIWVQEISNIERLTVPWTKAAVLPKM